MVAYRVGNCRAVGPYIIDLDKIRNELRILL